MTKNANVGIARFLSLIAVLFLIIALIFQILSLGNVHVGFGSFSGFFSGVLQGVSIVIIIIITLILLLITYSAIYSRLNRKSSKARDYSLLFGIIEIIVGIFTSEFMIIAGIFLLIAWIALEV